MDEAEIAAAKEEAEAFMAANKGKAPDPKPGEAPPGMKYVPDFTLLPQFLLITESPEDSLKARLAGA